MSSEREAILARLKARYTGDVSHTRRQAWEEALDIVLAAEPHKLREAPAGQGRALQELLRDLLEMFDDEQSMASGTVRLAKSLGNSEGLWPRIERNVRLLTAPQDSWPIYSTEVGQSLVAAAQPKREEGLRSALLRLVHEYDTACEGENFSERWMDAIEEAKAALAASPASGEVR